MERLYTCEQVAERYNVKKETVRSWIRNKMLLAIDLGKEYRIAESDLVNMEKSRRTVRK